MDSITKSFALILIGIMAISCVCPLTAKGVNAQSTHTIPEITILYPTNGTFFNVSIGFVSFPLKYATNNTLSWVGYSIDGGQNRTIVEERRNFDGRFYDTEGNPSIWVYDVGNSGNHKLTVYANNTVGDWATPQSVTYVVNINSDTTFPPTTSNPTTIQYASLSPTSTPTLSPRNAPHLDPIYYLIPVSVMMAVVLLSVSFFHRHRKTA